MKKWSNLHFPFTRGRQRGGHSRGQKQLRIIDPHYPPWQVGKMEALFLRPGHHQAFFQKVLHGMLFSKFAKVHILIGNGK